MRIAISQALLFHTVPYLRIFGLSVTPLAGAIADKIARSITKKDNSNFISHFFWSRLMPPLHSSGPYILAGDLIRDIERDIKKVATNYLRVISLKPEKPNAGEGNVLLSYINKSFLLKPGESIPITHTNYWESWQIAKTFLELGYCVDVIDRRNNRFIPPKEYSFFVDIRKNLERLTPFLNKDCVKILHIDVAHILFQNAAESRRLLELQQRKNITLPPQRFKSPNWAIEQADCATILGNEFTINTFKYANKPLYPVPIASGMLYPWLEEKDFDACRNHFLWFGSGGFVRKGLDLVLDAFAEMPECHLTVCGPIEQEKDFEQAFYKELYSTPNIHTVGWVDISSSKFTEIRNNCLGLIFPSSCEGQSGGVVTCLQAGLIPIISYESGVDVHNFGVILKTSSIAEIKDSVRMVSSLPAPTLKEMARNAWEYARANHTKERFAEAYRKAILKIKTDFKVDSQ